MRVWLLEVLQPALLHRLDCQAQAQGVGLGLWIVRQFAAAHGGQASAEARDPGVAMVVTFPVVGP